MRIERQEGGPGRLRTAGVRFHQRQMGRPWVSSKDNREDLAVSRGWFWGHYCPWEARLGKDDKGFAVRREDAERK